MDLVEIIMAALDEAAGTDGDGPPEQWRGHAERALRMLSKAGIRVLPPGEIDAETVEAACKAYWPLHWPDKFDKKDAESIRGHMRAAISAAIRSIGGPAREAQGGRDG